MKEQVTPEGKVKIDYRVKQITNVKRRLTVFIPAGKNKIVSRNQ
jgi:hypothetical protein